MRKRARREKQNGTSGTSGGASEIYKTEVHEPAKRMPSEGGRITNDGAL